MNGVDATIVNSQQKVIFRAFELSHIYLFFLFFSLATIVSLVLVTHKNLIIDCWNSYELDHPDLMGRMINTKGNRVIRVYQLSANNK